MQKGNTKMIVKVKRAYDLTRVCRQKGRSYAEIDGIRIVFEDGKLEGWYNPGPEEAESDKAVPSEDSVA